MSISCLLSLVSLGSSNVRAYLQISTTLSDISNWKCTLNRPCTLHHASTRNRSWPPFQNPLMHWMNWFQKVFTSNILFRIWDLCTLPESCNVGLNKRAKVSNLAFQDRPLLLLYVDWAFHDWIAWEWHLVWSKLCPGQLETLLHTNRLKRRFQMLGPSQEHGIGLLCARFAH